MPFLFCSAGRSLAVDLVDVREGATVADLARALDSAFSDATGITAATRHLTCAVDGIAAPGDLPLHEWVVVRGAVVTIVPTGLEPSRLRSQPIDPRLRAGTSETSRFPELGVVGGLHAGRSIGLRIGATVFGRSVVAEHDPAGTEPPCDDVTPRVDAALNHEVISLGDDPTVSRRHCEIVLHEAGPGQPVTVTVEDLGSTNGTLVNGDWCTTAQAAGPSPLRLGAMVCEVAAPENGDATRLPLPVALGGRHLPGDWASPFNRPPRRPPAPTPCALTTPTPPGPQGAAARLGMVAILAPLAVGVLMVFILHSVMWALFALLSPVMMLGSFWDQRRQGRKVALSGQRRFNAELASFEKAVRSAVDAERHERRRRATNPVEWKHRAARPGRRLWERRTDDAEWMRLSLGTGHVAWTPPLSSQSGDLDPRIAEVLTATAVLHDSPVEITLANGTTLGIVGDRGAALSLLRSLLTQAAVHHGPADLRIALLVEAHDNVSWATWLPHLADTTGTPRVACAGDGADDLTDDLLERADGSDLLVVITDPDLFVGRRAPARRLLGPAGPATGAVVVVDRIDQLPSRCGTIVELVDASGSATLSGRDITSPIDGLHLTGVGVGIAAQVARHLARLDDPDLDGGDPVLPDTIRLVDLAGIDCTRGAEAIAEDIGAHWRAAGDDPVPRLVIGVGPDGPVDVDLAADGPHILVAGTTGSGKSELLRTLVTGLAVAASPATVTFLLIDFKGGSAFDRLADLPHTVGLVTDLSPRMARRTVRCLSAEIRAREQLLRDAAASDLDELRVRSAGRRNHTEGPAAMMVDCEPPGLSRLVVVVDEFATLARELPDVLDALVSIAQRGRSLGVHLVLATQRPAGVVSDHIKANVGLRLALRLQDPADSVDVIDCDDAAHLPRRRPGRLLARFGPGELASLQVATVSDTARKKGRPPVTVAARSGNQGTWTTPIDGPESEAGTPSDLAVLVDAITLAQTASGAAPPRPVCPPPLPVSLDTGDLDDFGLDGDSLIVARADLPDEQAVRSVGWTMSHGILVLVGVPGSGTTTALTTIGLAAATADPSQLHVYAIDGAGANLHPLAALPHVGAVIEATGRERQRRLFSRLGAELQRRRGLGPLTDEVPRIVVLIDDFTSLANWWDDQLDHVMDDLAALVLDGTASGIHVALAIDRLSALPTAWLGACAHQWYFRLPDNGGMAVTDGVDLADMHRPPGRAFDRDAAHELQVAWSASGLDAAVEYELTLIGADFHRSACPVDVLPEVVAERGLAGATRSASGDINVPIGVGFDSLAPTGWTLHVGDHLVVTGPPRSGKSNALATIASVVTRGAAHGCPLALITASLRGHRQLSPEWHRALTPESDLAATVAAHLNEGRDVVVLIDDADRLPDDGYGLGDLIGSGSPHLHVIAAMGNDAARSSYGHFTRTMRASRQGLLLQPDLDVDGDLFGLRLPRRPPMALTPGRGFLVSDGQAELIAVADARDGRIPTTEGAAQRDHVPSSPHSAPPTFDTKRAAWKDMD